jgi:hypothetical protein
MNADQVTTQIMLAAEGAATRVVRASVRFETIGIMGRHMGL